MTLPIIVQVPPGVALDTLLLPRLSTAIRSGQSVWYLTPNAPSTARRVRTLARTTPVVDPPVGCIEQLCNRALRITGEPAPAAVDDTVVQLLLRDILARELRHTQPGPGLIRAAQRSIYALLADGFSCTSLYDALQRLVGETQATIPLNISALWRALEVLCPEVDHTRPLRTVLADNLIRRVAPTLLLIEGVPVTGNLSARLFAQLVEAVHIQSGEIVAVVPPVTTSHSRTARGIRFLVEQLGVSVTAAHNDISATLSDVSRPLQHIGRLLFDSSNTTECGTTEGIITLRAPDAASTADLVAREILTLIHNTEDSTSILDNGVTIVCPTNDDRRLITHALARHGIPVAMTLREPFASHPGGRYTIALLDLLEHGEAASLDTVLAILESDGWGLRHSVAERISTTLLRRGATCAHDVLSTLPPGRARTRLERLLALAADLRHMHTCRQYSNALRNAIHPRLASPDRKTYDPVRGAWSRHGATAAQDGHRVTPDVRGSSGWTRPIRRLDDLLMALTEHARRIGQEPPFATWASDLRALIADTEVQIGSTPSRGVRIQSPGLLDPCNVVFIVGLVEGRFPQRSRQDAFLPDSLRTALAAGFLMPPTLSADTPEHARETFYHSCIAARQRLYLCSPKGDGEGRQVLESFFVDDVRRCLGGGTPATLESRSIRIGDTVPSLNLASDKHELRAAVAAGLRDATLDESARIHVSRTFDVISSHDPEFRASILTPALDHHTAIRQESSRRYLQQRAERVSHSQLDAYAHCGYKHFIASRLEPETVDQPAFDALMQGSTVHEWLWEFGARHNGWTDTGHALSMLAAQPLPTTPASAFATNQSAADWAVWKSNVESFVRREVVRLSGGSFTPTHHELGFGRLQRRNCDPASRPDPVTLRFGRRKVAFSGSIDRVDTWTDPHRRRWGVVIDYKTGPVTQYGKAIQAGEELQLFLYMRVLAAWGIVPAAALYLSPRDGSVAGIIREDMAKHVGPIDGAVITVSRHDWRALRHQANDEIVRRHVDMQSGNIAARPRDWDCGFCDFRSICRIDLWRARTEAQTLTQSLA